MMIEHDGERPRISASAYVAPTAVVCGDVTVGDESCILFHAVVTADGGPVEIGSRCVVMEHALVRGRVSHPVKVGDNVLVGPHSHVNGATIASDAFLATGASVFPGARVGAGAEIRIGGVLHVNSSLPPGAVVPIGWIAVGDPAEVLPPERHDEIWAIQRHLDFPGTVFGLQRRPADELMPEAMRRYAESFGRHCNDRIIEP
jgi:gamma-carbonic anhydrase